MEGSSSGGGGGHEGDRSKTQNRMGRGCEVLTGRCKYTGRKQAMKE